MDTSYLISPDLVLVQKNHGSEDWGAIFSEDRKYRYLSWRVWEPTTDKCVFIMLNPSIADEERDDPTQRRCRSFAVREGYGGYLVGNVYALVSTDPALLKKTLDPIGRFNDQYLESIHKNSKITIAAWGTNGGPRAIRLGKILASGKPLVCLGLNEDGSPKHPLYVKGSTELVVYKA